MLCNEFQNPKDNFSSYDTYDTILKEIVLIIF